MRRAHRNPERRRGVVMIITLLAIVLIAALIMWVLNLGQQVNRRLTAQQAADASAQAGAGWVARSLNTVAGNNVHMARLIALINVLDGMPQSVEFSHRETDAWRQRLADQMNRGIGGSPDVLTQQVTYYYQQLLNEMYGDVDELAEMMSFFAGFDVGEMTNYGRRGRIWRALEALDEVNQATMDDLAEPVRLAAMLGGDANLDRNEDAASHLLPLEARVPYQRGRFDDFERPVRYGLLPRFEDDMAVRRGPWDTIYGWRDLGRRVISGGTYVPGTIQVVGGGGGGGPFSSGAGSNGRVVGRQTEVVAYRTYGPQTWMMRRLRSFVSRDLRTTRLDDYNNYMAETKRRFIWPADPNPFVNANVSYWSGYGTNWWNLPAPLLRGELVEPDWIIEFEQAQVLNPADIFESAFFVVEIKSKYPIDDAAFMTPGTWALVRSDAPRISVRRGDWHNPERWPLRPNVVLQRTNDYVWRTLWDYQVHWDSTIGIEPIYQTITNPDGTTSQVPVPQPVYRMDYFVFGGVNVGVPATISNPYEGFDPGSGSAPSPMLLRHDLVPHDNAASRRRYLSYLSLVRRTDAAQAWSSRFRGGRPYPNMVAMAQARVFNNHSWDLWTQMWHAELEPVRDYDQWLTELDEPAPPGVSGAELGRLQEYLTNARELALITLGH